MPLWLTLVGVQAQVGRHLDVQDHFMLPCNLGTTPQDRRAPMDGCGGGGCFSPTRRG